MCVCVAQWERHVERESRIDVVFFFKSTSVDMQIPAEKVFFDIFWGPNTFSAGVWMIFGLINWLDDVSYCINITFSEPETIMVNQVPMVPTSSFTCPLHRCGAGNWYDSYMFIHDTFWYNDILWYNDAIFIFIYIHTQYIRIIFIYIDIYTYISLPQGRRIHWFVW